MAVSDFTSIVGQPLATSLLQSMVNVDDYKQSFLFYGPAGTGKLSAALQFAKAAMFDVTTKQNVTTSADLLLLEPASGREYAVEQIRELNEYLTYRPQSAKRRVAILQNAEKLNPASVGAFLKTLEEPPGNAIIILLTDAKLTLADTIISRCYAVPFLALAQTSAVAELMSMEKIDAPAAELALALSGGSGGSPLAAQNFWKSEGRRALRQDVIEIMLSLPTITFNDLCAAVMRLIDTHKLTRPKQSDSAEPSGQKQLNRQFDQNMHLLYITICLFYLDAIRVAETEQISAGQNVQPQLVNYDYAPSISSFMQELRSQHSEVKSLLTCSLAEVSRLFANLIYNINSEVQISALFISLRKIIQISG